jgi:hypothetical protein
VLVSDHPLFTVVIPTIGRPSLARTLASIDRRYADVLVVADAHEMEQRDSLKLQHLCEDFEVGCLYFDAGVHDTGSPQLHLGFLRAQGAWVLNVGDDDVYEPGAFEMMAEIIARQAEPTPLMFKTEMHANGRRGNLEPVVLWEEQTIRRGSVTGQGFVCPNDPRRMGRWVNDWTFIRETVALHGDRIEWRPELTVRCY